MREIKFRVWIGGKFYYYGFINSGNGLGFYAPPSTNKEPLSFEEVQGRSQQFTGLKSKSGVEIYEGDIVERIDGSLRVIKWSLNSHSFEWFSSKLPDRFWNSDAQDWEASEIIGNIWENPDLLKEVK